MYVSCVGRARLIATVANVENDSQRVAVSTGPGYKAKTPIGKHGQIAPVIDPEGNRMGLRAMN